MPVWLVPAGLYWPVAALYLGGIAELKGGTPFRQVIGLVAGFILFMLLWWGLGKLLVSIGPVLGGVIIPLAISVVATPWILRLGYRGLGIRIEREAAPGH
jgi:hypothetical protein